MRLQIVSNTLLSIAMVLAISPYANVPLNAQSCTSMLQGLENWVVAPLPTEERAIQVRMVDLLSPAQGVIAAEKTDYQPHAYSGYAEGYLIYHPAHTIQIGSVPRFIPTNLSGVLDQYFSDRRFDPTSGQYQGVKPTVGPEVLGEQGLGLEVYSPFYAMKQEKVGVDRLQLSIQLGSANYGTIVQQLLSWGGGTSTAVPQCHGSLMYWFSGGTVYAMTLEKYTAPANIIY